MKYSGVDNNGNAKGDYLIKLAEMSDHELFLKCKDMIWFSAYASNNPRSDYHWQCDACYDECEHRGKSEIYDEAYKFFTKF